MRDEAGQARPDCRDVRKRRAVRPTQRRLQLEGRPERDALRSGCAAVSAGRRSTALAAARHWPPHPMRRRRCPRRRSHHSLRPGHRQLRGPRWPRYTEADLADSTKGKTWQSMLMPPSRSDDPAPNQIEKRRGRAAETPAESAWKPQSRRHRAVCRAPARRSRSVLSSSWPWPVSAGWLGYRVYQAHRHRRGATCTCKSLRQAAVNLDHDQLHRGRRRHSADPGLGDRRLSR